ncbi:hypothetical protein [Phytoactinopolyspora halophila]|nr:hypothetical protein [Phytoactinopolyspora halophila]
MTSTMSVLADEPKPAGSAPGPAHTTGPPCWLGLRPASTTPTGCAIATVPTGCSTTTVPTGCATTTIFTTGEPDP